MYDSFVITLATRLGVDGTILDRTSLGGLRDIEATYEGGAWRAVRNGTGLYRDVDRPGKTTDRQ